jgi:hypothetical protein
MSRIFVSCALLWFASITCAEEATVSPLAWTYRYVLSTALAENEFDPLLQGIRLDEDLRSATLDYLAEALVSPLNREMSAEARLRLARFLATQGDARYRDVLARTLRGGEGAEIHDLVSRHGKRWRHSKEPQYLPGTIDFEKLRAQYAAAALAYEPTDAAARKLAALPADSSIENLFELVGTPHAVVSGAVSATDGLLINIKIRRLSIYYRGIGRVVFAFRKYDQWKSQGVVIDPEAFEALMPYRERPLSRVASADDALAFTQLLNGHPMAMKVAVESRWRTRSATPEFLDATAEVLLAQHAGARTAHELDVYAWMCRLLNSHGGPRYAAILATVARDTHDEKLRRFASLPIQRPNGVDTARYVAGSVSLAELRAKYPAPYPARTFLSGAL